MVRALTRLLTLRRVGIVGAVAGAVALVAPFAPAAWRWFWPDPVATIGWPEEGESLAGCFDIGGQLDPSTFWRRHLWLIADRDRDGWRPVRRIATWMPEWAYRTCVYGRTGDWNEFALVVADGEQDAAFARALAEPVEEEIPDWLKRRNTGEQGGRCRGTYQGYNSIPTGASLVASVRIRVHANDQPCFRVPPGAYDVWSSGAEQREGRGRHDERRGLRGHHGLQGSVVRGVPGGGRRVGGRGP
jgi:hypothetical protein